MAKWQAGDRVQIAISPDVKGEIVTVGENGEVGFRSDGHTDTFEFHEDSFEAAV